MKATTAPKFTVVPRVIGGVLMAAGVAGVGYSGFLSLILLKGWAAAHWSADYFGSPYGSVALSVLAAVFGIAGLFLGIVAWSFLKNRRVFKCDACGYLLDRA